MADMTAICLIFLLMAFVRSITTRSPTDITYPNHFIFSYSLMNLP
jgi:hypothetical protein